MDITVRNSQRKHPVDRARLVRLALRALGLLDLAGAQLSVAIVGDRKIRQLNREYRGVDGATDVLSFSQSEGEGGGLHPEVLGDVVISAERAADQAGRYRRTLDRELDTLLVHGILHLAGFDHEKGRGEGVRMKKLERKILRGWKG